MISHTVYRGRNNAIVLQLLADGEPLQAPEAILDVELSVGDSLVLDTESEFIDYDEGDGQLTALLGRIPEVAAMADGNYEIEITGYGSGNEEGVAFGSFLIYLRDWAGEVPSGS